MKPASVFESLSVETPAGRLSPSALYWWKTAGRQVATMLEMAQYPDDAQRRFLEFFRDTLSPSLGAAPKEGPAANSALTWDGTPIEYSLSFSGSIHKPNVRFSLDLSPLRPAASPEDAFDTTTTVRVAEEFAANALGTDLTWYHSLNNYCRISPTSPADAQRIVSAARHQTPTMLGFDINRAISTPNGDSRPPIPAMGKSYFLPWLPAAERGITPWQVVRGAIRQLPDLAPNVSTALDALDKFIATKTPEWETGIPYLATDLIDPSKSRLKIYILPPPAATWEEVWDTFTLGGQITSLDGEKEKFHDLYRLLVLNSSRRQESNGDLDATSLMETGEKMSMCYYYSLCASSPLPQTKLCFYARGCFADDGVMAAKLQDCMEGQGWACPCDTTTTGNRMAQKLMSEPWPPGARAC